MTKIYWDRQNQRLVEEMPAGASWTGRIVVRDLRTGFIDSAYRAELIELTPLEVLAYSSL